jgi:hypothetical protein
MERRHTDLLDTIEPNSLGSTRVQTTSFRTTTSLMMGAICSFPNVHHIQGLALIIFPSSNVTLKNNMPQGETLFKCKN